MLNHSISFIAKHRRQAFHCCYDIHTSLTFIAFDCIHITDSGELASTDVSKSAVASVPPLQTSNKKRICRRGTARHFMFAESCQLLHNCTKNLIRKGLY